MVNEKLIAYLENEMAARDAKLVDYNAVKDEIANLRQALLEAESKLDSFTGIETIVAEKAELQGFIDELTASASATPIEEMVAAVEEKVDPQPIVC